MSRATINTHAGGPLDEPKEVRANAGTHWRAWTGVHVAVVAVGVLVLRYCAVPTTGVGGYSLTTLAASAMAITGVLQLALRFRSGVTPSIGWWLLPAGPVIFLLVSVRPAGLWAPGLGLGVSVAAAIALWREARRTAGS